MSNNELTKRLKELRKRKGFSQEELAESTGLSLRTIQRIENGETEPRSDSLKRLADALNLPADEVLDWTIKEDRNALISLNLSGLIAVFFPILGILITYMMWLPKKDKIAGARQLGRALINFQITLTLLFLLSNISVIVLLINAFDTMEMQGMSGSEGDVGPITSALKLQFIIYLVFNVYNVVLVIINTLKVKRGKEAHYLPQLRFLKG